MARRIRQCAMKGLRVEWAYYKTICSKYRKLLFKKFITANGVVLFSCDCRCSLDRILFPSPSVDSGDFCGQANPKNWKNKKFHSDK